MKIESSEIMMGARTSFNFEMKSSTEFSSQIINQNIDMKELNIKQDFVKVQTNELEKILVSNEKQLSHLDKMKKMILELFLGKVIKKEDFTIKPTKEDLNTAPITLLQTKETNFKLTREYYQESNIEFNTKALVKTNRGEIHIDLDLSFSQKFAEVHESSYTSRETVFMDPLIINYHGNLTSYDNISPKMRFEFDLNSDGENELIPELKKGAGFLALDKDNNGKIDNGNELFGANSGDGFGELSQYDEDGNSWIDENDSVFNDLLVWEKNEEGENSLITLGQAGIGAIYLAAADSAYTYASGINENYAQLKQSSFYLKENGEAGLVTSVDFATEQVV